MEHSARIVIIVFLAISLIAADHLYYLRKPHEMMIKGTLCLEPDQPIKGVQVDADVHFRQLTVKVNPQGQQSIMLRSVGSRDQWALKPDFPAYYSMLWRKEGTFELTLVLWAKSRPRSGRLTFHFANGAYLRGKPFRLKTARRRMHLVGWSPPIVLTQLPAQTRRAGLSPRPTSRSEETPEAPEAPEENAPEPGSGRSEEEEIRARAESALLHINTLSPTTLRVRSQLIDYLESHPVYMKNAPGARTKQIGILLRDILNKKTELMGILTSGQLSPPQPNSDPDWDITPLEIEGVEEGPAEEEDQVAHPVGD